MVGSPCLALGGPTSFYLTAAKNAENHKDHRKAIYCLSIVLLDVLENRPSAKGLSQKTLISELKTVFTKAALQDKAKELNKLSGAQLSRFLESEMNNADPGKTIEVFSDGSFDVRRKPWNSPYPTRPELSSCSSTWSSVVLIGSPEYDNQLRKYWWFKMPSSDVLATKPKYTPSKIEAQSLPDGAFRH